MNRLLGIGINKVYEQEKADEIEIILTSYGNKRFREGVESLWKKTLSICDCHTWPNLKEMHDYVEALEDKFFNKEKRT